MLSCDNYLEGELFVLQEILSKRMACDMVCGEDEGFHVLGSQVHFDSFLGFAL